ncbi:MAG: hypothetical protein ACODAU_02805 [Myxococcota bacterium]
MPERERGQGVRYEDVGDAYFQERALRRHARMASFILLRIRRPEMARPYRSPFGVAGVAVSFAIALVTLVALFVVDEGYRLAVLGAAVWYGLGRLYFALWARHRLVYAPEEAFATEGTSARP